MDKTFVESPEGKGAPSGRRPQDFLGISIVLSVAIFAALFVLSQVAEFMDYSSRQLQASELQRNDLRSGIHQLPR